MLRRIVKTNRRDLSHIFVTMWFDGSLLHLSHTSLTRNSIHHGECIIEADVIITLNIYYDGSSTITFNLPDIRRVYLTRIRGFPYPSA